MTSSTTTITENKPCDIGRKQEQKDIKTPIDNKSYYDQVLPKNDPKFLAPVRRWEKRMGFITPIRWPDLTVIFMLHALHLTFSLYMLFIRGPSWKTVPFNMIYATIGGFGVTAGAHRYWTHRSFKANVPLRIILMLCFTCAGQNKIFYWVRNHRVHHKNSDTSADPHDITRGFFYAHMGWLMMKKHPHAIVEGMKLDMSDILNDPFVKFHTKFFIPLIGFFSFILPTIIPVYFWAETWDMAIMATIIRYTTTLNMTWSVNSIAHLWGNRPYNTGIMPSENWLVSVLAVGEGWHNYHHSFPWDYKASELAYFVNFTTVILDFFARLGWAYDLKTASPELVKAVVKKTGPKLL